MTFGKLQPGVWFALAAAVLFGISAPIAKGFLGSASPELVAGLLYSGSGIGLAILSVVQTFRRRDTAFLTRHDLPWLAGAIAAGGVLAPLLLMIGLNRTPASTTSLLLNLEGVFTALLAWTVFKENVDRRIAIGMMLIVLGGAILTWQGNAFHAGLSGPLLIVAACGCWAVDNNLTQKVSAANPVRIAMLKGLVAGATNVGIALWLGARFPGISTVAGSMSLGFVSYGLSLVLFIAALQRLGTARTSAYFSLGPFVGAAASMLLWREPLTFAFGFAAVLMAVGLFFHFSERHEHAHRHERLVHSHAHVHDEHHQHTHEAGDPDGEPHTHLHVHSPLEHSHPHYPDIHHRHEH